MLVFEQIRVGGDRNFGYLLGDRDAKQAVLIDPSYTPEILVERAREQELQVTHVINTHGHDDHINGNAKAIEMTRALLAAHPDSPVKPILPLKDEQELTVGTLRLKFYHTPGHCDDHLVIYEQTCQLLITGDFIFVGKVGGTEDDNNTRIQWNSLQRIVKLIPDYATIWPGHDVGVRPSSTLGIEKNSNPFLLCPDLKAFHRLKDDWPIYKKLHGLK